MAHAQVLREPHEFGHGGLAGTIARILVLHQFSEPDTPVLAGAVERQRAFFEQLDQVGPRNVQQVCGLLGGQLGMDRHHLHRVAFGQFGQDVDQQA